MASVLGWIGERIEIDPPPALQRQGHPDRHHRRAHGRRQDHDHREARRHLRARGRAEPARRVRIITIDNYRIAAKQQIETYAEIMRIPVSLVESAADLQKCLAALPGH